MRQLINSGDQFARVGVDVIFSDPMKQRIREDLLFKSSTDCV